MMETLTTVNWIGEADALCAQLEANGIRTFVPDQGAVTANPMDANAKHVTQVAKTAKRPAGAPQYSDVCFSSRWPRPQSAKDPYDTLTSARAFHATRMDWVYTQDAEWIRKMKNLGFHMGIAMPINWFKTELSVQGRDGKGQEMTIGCANNPEFRSLYLDSLKPVLDAGADVLQTDEPGMNFTRRGCWCTHCRALAKGKEVNLDRDWKIFSKQSVVEFWHWARKTADEHAGRRVPWSCNIEWSEKWDGSYKDIHGRFDFGMSDTHKIHKALYWYKRCVHARQFGKAETIQNWSREKNELRGGIASLYACGGHLIVPWDAFTGAGGDRYFGKPEDYADIYGFVRAIPQYLNGYEDALAFGPSLEDDRYGTQPPLTIKGGSGELYAFARAKPDQPKAPVVIHLVEWSTSRPVEIELRNSAFFSGSRSTIKLLVPSPFNKTEHDKAEEESEKMRKPGERRGATHAIAYSALVKTIGLETKQEGEFTKVTVPQLNPWGILVLEQN